MVLLPEDIRECIRKWVILFDEAEARAYWTGLRATEPVLAERERIAQMGQLQWNMKVHCMYYDGYLRRERLAPTMENIMNFKEFMFLDRFFVHQVFHH